MAAAVSQPTSSPLQKENPLKKLFKRKVYEPAKKAAHTARMAYKIIKAAVYVEHAYKDTQRKVDGFIHNPLYVGATVGIIAAALGLIAGLKIAQMQHQ